MSPEPGIAVVVPTRNRAHLLARLARCLAEQEGVSHFEVVVVDDSSTDDTAAVLSVLTEAMPYTLRTARTATPSGAAAARNIGVRMTTAPLVAFTDDDCRPSSGWLKGLIDAFAHADVVQGPTTFEWTELSARTPFTQVIEIGALTGQFETSNVAYRRTDLIDVGGFDERFDGDSYGEDVDLGWRVTERGARVAFAVDAVVVHDVKSQAWIPDVIGAVRGMRRWRHIGRVLRDHPGYREAKLARAPFFAASHPPTLLALGGLAGLALRPRHAGVQLAAAAAFLPWLHHRAIADRRPGRRRHLPIILPVAFVLDAVETITIIASGVRYGVLVL